MHIIKLEQVNDKQKKEIDEVWRSAVINSHDFLSNEVIKSIEPEVLQGVSTVQSLYIQEDNDRIISFMGIEDYKIEMLFIHNDYRNKGLGTKLVEFSFEKENVDEVDVNEQNSSGLAFYKKVGFIQYDRTEFDESGRPYPIIHMKRKLNI